MPSAKGYPEVAEAFKRYAFEEADHASRLRSFGRSDHHLDQKNLELRAEAGIWRLRRQDEIAKRAKELNLDAIHDTVHEMARDEARHGKGFEGLLKVFRMNPLNTYLDHTLLKADATRADITSPLLRKQGL